MAILRSPEAILIGSNNEPFINAAKHFKMINIKTQPKAVTAETGKKVSFTVKESGDALTYQWQYSDNNGKTWKNSTAVSGKTATLSITVNESQTNRLYRCVIKDKYNSKKATSTAKLIVTPAITGQPASVTTTAGKKVSFKVSVTGEGLTYQWQYSDDNGKTWKNSTAVSGKTATLSITVNEKQTNRLYHCVITNKYGVSVTSNNAKLIVKAATTTASTTVKTTKATTTVKTTAKTTAKSTSKAATTVKTTAKTTAKSTSKAATTVKTTAKTTAKSTSKAATTVKTTAKTTAKSTTKAATTVKTTAKTTTKAA